MEALIASLINKQQSSAEMIGILILEELRMMRKDVNSGISKLQENFERLETACKLNEGQNNVNEEEPSENYELTIESVESNIEENNSNSDDFSQGNCNTNQLHCNIDRICENMRIKQETNNVGQALFSNTEHCEKPYDSLSASLHRTPCSTKTMQILGSNEVPTDAQSQKAREEAVNARTSLIPLSASSTTPSHFLEKHKLNYTCKICMKSHTSSHMLKRHYIEVHHHANKNVCSFCGRACYNATDLRVHIRTHTGEKPFKCRICEKAFADKSNYTRHCRMRKDLTCYQCNKVVCTKLQLYQHRASHQS